MKFLLLLISMTLAVAGQFLIKAGVTSSNLFPDINSIFQTLITPHVFFGLALYGLSAIFWLFVLQKFPLSVAYPALSLTYIVVLTLSYIIFKEPVTSYKIAGILFIIFGVFLIFR
jgi:multidrug transporter EmrE-like cation transporter